MPIIVLRTPRNKRFKVEIDAKSGVTLIYAGSPQKTVSWRTVKRILKKAAKLYANQKIEPGLDLTAQTTGSLGHYVNNNSSSLSGLTSKNLSHLGPVLAHIGVLKRIRITQRKVRWELW